MTHYKPKHILIIYENTGGGHLNIARILQKMLTAENIKITLVTASALAKNSNDVFVHGWNYLIRKNWLRTADLLLNFFARIILLPFSYILYDKMIFTALDTVAPDIVISTSDCNRTFGSYCAKRKIPFFIFMNAPAMFVDILSLHATHLVYFQEAVDIIQSFKTTAYFTTDITPDTPWSTRLRDLGQQLARYTVGYPWTPYFSRYYPNLPKRNALKVHALGPFRGLEFYQHYDTKAVKQRYQIPEEGSCVIISSGSLGGMVTKKIIQAFTRHQGFVDKINLLVVCGSDQALYTELSTQSTEHPSYRIIPISQQPNLADLYTIADCSIGRGTAGILLDSLVSKTPLIVLNYITCNDFGTLDIIQRHQIGEIAYHYSQITELLTKVLSDPEHYNKAIEKLLAQYPNSDYEAVKNRMRQLIMDPQS